MRLIVIRHGETDWNCARKVQGATDTQLNDTGKMQAQKIGERLSRMRLDGVISSPLQRAYETAAAIADKGRLPLSTSEDLIELDLGDWEGFTFPEIETRYPQEHALWRERPDLCVIPGSGESIAEAEARMRNWVETLYQEHPEKSFALVTHTWPAKLILLNAVHAGARQAHSLRLDNASMSIVERYGDGWVLRLVNDISHLRRSEGCRISP